ncbi:MAG TPA: ABC transporter permease [Thermoanaerobaculia bacterium]
MTIPLAVPETPVPETPAAAGAAPAPTSEPAPRLSLGAMLATTRALVERDLAVLLRDLPAFLLRTAMQPALFAFVFAYVFPRIGQGIGGARDSAAFAAVLLPGLMANTLMFQGVTAVALPLVSEFSVSKEIEDRVMAPVPVRVVGLTKVISGSVQALLASLMVIPAVWIATGFHTTIHWDHPLRLATLLPLGALVGSSLGLMLGTLISPRRINYLFALLLLPLTLLGCVYYPWVALSALRWLQIAVLANPVVYMSEGLRAALSPQIPHMPLWAIYGLLGAAFAAMLWIGLAKFEARVLS